MSIHTMTAPRCPSPSRPCSQACTWGLRPYVSVRQARWIPDVLLPAGCRHPSPARRAGRRLPMDATGKPPILACHPVSIGSAV